MGLAGAKRKQRLVGAAVGRNASWLTDTSLPGQHLLSQMGWSEGQGLGTSADAGRTEAIKAMFKMDNKGIGSQRAEKELREQGGGGRADGWAGGGGDLGSLFERLNAAGSGTSTPDVISEPIALEPSSSKGKAKDEPPKKRKRSRQEDESTAAASSSDTDADSSKKKKSKSKDKDSKKEKKSKSKDKSGKKDEKDKSKSSKEEVTPPIAEEKAKQIVRNASRAKYLRAKRQLYGDAVSMNEILGISASGSSSPAPSGSPAPASTSRLTDISSPSETAPVVALAQEILAEEESPAVDVAAVETDKEKRRREKKEKKERKEEAKAVKESSSSKKKKDKTAQASQKAAVTLAEPPPEAPPVTNIVSPLSVHEYLSRRLMLKKAQVMRQRKADQEAVWGRLNGGVGVMVEH